MAEIKLPKHSKKGDLPVTQSGWVKYINTLHDERLSQRRPKEFQWVVNLAYYLGYQNLSYNLRSGALEMSREEQPLTINRIGSFIDARHAKITKSNPIAKVIPNTPDDEDVAAAKRADKALTYLWRKIDMSEEYERMIMLMLITGTAFVRTVWDPIAGESIREAEEDGETLVDEEGIPKLEKIFMGEVRSDALSAFAVLPGSEAIPKTRDQPYLIERNFLPIAEVEAIYPHLKGKIGKPKSEIKTEYEKLIDRMASPVFTALRGAEISQDDSINGSVLVKTFMMKPNAQYEDGLVVVVVENELAMMTEFPNDFGKNVYPYVKFTEREDGFHFWGQSTIERLIPIQKAFNKLRQQKVKNAGLLANGKWLLAKGSQVVDDALNDEEGEVIEYNPAVPKPEQARLSPMPQYSVELPRELIIDFRDVGGQRESSVTPPPNLTAGVAIENAAELADEAIGPILRHVARGLQLVGNQQLILMTEEYTDPRVVKVMGAGGKISMDIFRGTDFRNHTDVHIEVESMFPDFRGSKRQTLFDMWDRRIIQDPGQFLELFRFGNWDKLTEELEQLKENVYLDIKQLKNGKMPEINQFQNHIVYVNQLSKFIQTPEFMALIPERKQQTLQLLQLHIAALQGGGLPQQGQAVPQQNQAAVGTEFGPVRPVQ